MKRSEGVLGGLGLVVMCVGMVVGGGCSGGGEARGSSATGGGERQGETRIASGRAVEGTGGQGATLVREPEAAVVIDGSTIPWSALRGALAELGGAVVLEELALDRALEREAARRGITVGEEAIAAEERALLDELEVAAGTNRMEVLEGVRRSRGLGPSRYEALLRRNALLRAMVRDQAAPSAAEVELSRRLAFGETRRVRLFVAGSESAASAMRQTVAGAPVEQRSWVFADRAVTGSEHPSAARGGLIERFHPEDPAYPGILGNAARGLEPGGVSAVLATASGFAVVLVEGVNPGREATAAETARVERRVRQRKERLAMESLARELINRSRVSPVDPDLARAWQGRR
jgi:hypothetical protein